MWCQNPNTGTYSQVATKTVHLLHQLLNAHPRMKLVVAREVERLLFRSNIDVRTQHHAVTFLNQIILTNQEQELARLMMDLYFALFKVEPPFLMSLVEEVPCLWCPCF